MELTKIVTKSAALIAMLGIFAMTFQSCQREGCPGQITKVTEVQTEVNC